MQFVHCAVQYIIQKGRDHGRRVHYRRIGVSPKRGVLLKVAQLPRSAGDVAHGDGARVRGIQDRRVHYRSVGESPRRGVLLDAEQLSRPTGDVAHGDEGREGGIQDKRVHYRSIGESPRRADAEQFSRPAGFCAPRNRFKQLSIT